MINGIKDDDHRGLSDDDEIYKVKNEYSWKEKGGSKLLNNLYDENSIN